ncbi:NAD(P)-dependent oxidoreductase [Thalassiella azotivora]
MLDGAPVAPGALRGVTVGVTGASGFCGGVVARAALEAGADVVTLGRRPGPVGSHRTWDAVAGAPDLAGVDVLVHLAAAVGDPARGRPARAFEAVNVDGARRVLDAAGDRAVVWVSSASVYDPRVDRSLVTEDHPTAGGHLNAYGRTKAAGERLALAAGAVVLRPHAVYGEGDHHLLPRLLRTARRGVAVLPGPDVPVSLTAVENLATACLLGARWAPGAYNVADAEPYRRDDVVARVLTAATGGTVRVRHVPVALADRAADVLGSVGRVLPVEPVVTRYAVDQVSAPFVLATARAGSAGWRAHRDAGDYLAVLAEPAVLTGGAGGPPGAPRGGPWSRTPA